MIRYAASSRCVLWVLIGSDWFVQVRSENRDTFMTLGLSELRRFRLACRLPKSWLAVLRHPGLIPRLDLASILATKLFQGRFSNPPYVSAERSFARRVSEFCGL